MNKTRFFTLVSIAGIYFFSMFQRVAVPGTVFDELQAASAVAVLGSIYLYIYGAMQIFAGMSADKFGSSKMIIAGGLLLSAGSLVFPFPSEIAFLYIARAAVGLGASLIYISMMKHINMNFSAGNFPLVFAFSIVLGYGGGLAGTYPFERLVSYTGWQRAFFLAGAASLLLTAASSLRLRRMLVCKECSFSVKALKSVLKNKRIFPVAISGSANFSVYFVLLATIGKKMLEDTAALSSSSAAFFTFALMVSAMVSLVFHGYRGKRTSVRKPYSILSGFFCLAGASVILFNLYSFKHPALFFAGYVFCGWAGGNILNPTLVKEMNLPESAATAAGFYNTVMFTSVAAAGHLSGKLMDLFTASPGPGRITYPPQAHTSIFSLCVILGIIPLASAMAIKEFPRAYIAAGP